MTVYIDRPIEADWWPENLDPRGYAVPDELWAEYVALKARAEEIEAVFETAEYRDDRVLTPEQIEAERQSAEWALSLVPWDTPFFNRITRDKR